MKAPWKHTDETDCWCEPLILRVCPECEGVKCAVCDHDGLIFADKADCDPDESVSAVHRYCQGCIYFATVCGHPHPDHTQMIMQVKTRGFCDRYEMQALKDALKGG